MDFKSLLSKLDVISSKQNLNEGWEDMMKATKERGEKEKKEKGTGKFDKKETSTGTVYTRKASTFDDGGDDKDTKKAKEKAKKAKVKEAEEQVDEDDVEEGNEFSGARDAAIKAGKKEFTVGGKTYPVKESEEKCNHTAKGEKCPVHGLKECGMYESKEEKCDDCGKPVDDCECDDHDHEDDKDEKKKVDESMKALEECYDQAMGQPSQPESGMNISSNMDTKTGNQSLTVSAQGSAANELAQLLKLSGIIGGGSHEVEMGEAEGEYANVPKEKMQPMSTQLAQGNDMHSQGAEAPKVNGGGNPMTFAARVSAMEARAQAEIDELEQKLMEQLNSIKVIAKK